MSTCQACQPIGQIAQTNGTYLRESTVVPDVTVVREAVADVAQTALLDILLDGVEGLLLGDLELRVGPAGNLNDHVEDAIVLVGEERDVVEGRDDGLVGCPLDEDAVLCERDAMRLAGTLLCCQIDLPRVLAAPIWRVVYSVRGTVSTASRTSETARTDGSPW